MDPAAEGQSVSAEAMIWLAALVAVVLLAGVGRRVVRRRRLKAKWDVPDVPTAFMESGGSHLSREFKP